MFSFVAAIRLTRSLSGKLSERSADNDIALDD